MLCDGSIDRIILEDLRICDWEGKRRSGVLYRSRRQKWVVGWSILNAHLMLCFNRRLWFVGCDVVHNVVLDAGTKTAGCNAGLSSSCSWISIIGCAYFR